MTHSWAEDIVSRVAAEVRRLRGRDHASLSASKLSERTAELGHPMSRAVLAGLESGRKKSLEVSELLVLAAALEVSPAQLLFPDLPRGEVEVLPGVQQESHDALRWLGGEAGLLLPTEGHDVSARQSVEVSVRRAFDPRNDRVGITRQWLQALETMRRARTELRTGLHQAESREHLESMHFVYDNARKRAEELFSQMVDLEMSVGQAEEAE